MLEEPLLLDPTYKNKFIMIQVSKQIKNYFLICLKKLCLKNLGGNEYTVYTIPHNGTTWQTQPQPQFQSEVHQHSPSKCLFLSFLI